MFLSSIHALYHLSPQKSCPADAPSRKAVRLYNLFIVDILAAMEHRYRKTLPGEALADQTKTVKGVRPLRFWPMGLILMTAAAFRWYRPGLVEFKYDEAHIFGMARGIASGGFWPVLSGGTSIGLPRSALDAYILALPMTLAGHSPQVVIIWLGMLGVLAVALSYELGRLLAGRTVGWLTALYMALNPWLIFYDRKLWAHIQVLFSVLLCLLAWQVIRRESSRARFWFPIIAALQLLTHVLALVQLFSWIGGVLAAPRRWWRKSALLGGAIGLVLILPYGWALARWWLGKTASQTPMPQTSLTLPTASDLIARWKLGWVLFGGDRIFELTGSGARVTDWDLGLRVVAWAVASAIALGMIRTLWWLQDGERRQRAIFLLAWTVGPFLALSFGPWRVYLQYWTVMLPLPAIYFALGLSWLRLRALSPPWPVAKSTALALTVFALFFLWDVAWMDVLARIDAGAGRQTFGRPLQDWQEGLTTANRWANELHLNQIKVLARGVDPSQDSEPAAIAALIGNPPYARFLDLSGPTPGLLLHVEEPSLYLITGPQMDVILAQVGEEVWQEQKADPLRLYLLPPSTDVHLPIQRLSPPPTFDLGVSLIGYAFPTPWPAGEPVQVTLVWRMQNPTQTARENDFTAFNHIVAANSENKVAQVDGMALLSRDWWPDDVLYQSYFVTISEPGDYQWLAGLYSRQNGARGQILTGGDTVVLPFTVKR